MATGVASLIVAAFVASGRLDSSVFMVVVTAPFLIVGAIVLRREPANPIGWLLLATGVLEIVDAPLGVYAAYGDTHGGAPLWEWAGWVNAWTIPPLLYGPLIFLLLLFPTGRLPFPAARAVAWFAGLALALDAVAWALARGTLADSELSAANPAGVLPSWVQPVADLGTLAAFLAAAAVLVVRLRRSRGVERLQLTWFAYAGAIAGSFLALGILADIAFGASSVASNVIWIPAILSVLLIPVCVALAITRHRLYEIELVIDRTLVYGTLTALVLAGYGLAVYLASVLASGAGSAVAPAAAALVAMAAIGLRTRLQRGVRRTVFGDRDDPYRALLALGDRLESSPASEEVPPAIVQAVSRALRVPHAEILLLGADGTERPAAATGTPRGEPVSVPLVYGGERVGTLLVSPRSDAPFDARDLRLLNGLATQAGAAVHSVQLTLALQHSREALVAAREEERRRLRRDLHDGLGPALAGIALQLRTAEHLLDDPEQLRGLLRGIGDEARETTAEVRRLVYDLRPPQLDELGLTGALREQAGRFQGQLDVSVAAPDELPPLPAAVEVAAYRIVTEALTNVARHAEASSCRVVLALNGSLDISIVDDGRGIAADARHGVGLGSMRERAAELGGTCVIRPAAPRGTRVLARLPV
jgi:signal transduction histidine kinase